MCSSSYNLVLVSLERYAGVVHPIWHKRHVTRRRVLAVLPVVWLIGPLFNGMMAIPSSKVIEGYCYLFWVWPSDIVRRVMGISVFVTHFFVPLAFYLFCYGKMAFALRAKVTPQLDLNVPHPSETAGHRSANKRKAMMNILRTLVIVVLCSVVCWGINQTYFALYNLGLDYPYIDFASPVYHFTVVLTFFNCCLNPFVYAAKYRQFQEGVRRLFGVKRTGGATTTMDTTKLSARGPNTGNHTAAHSSNTGASTVVTVA